MSENRGVKLIEVTGHDSSDSGSRYVIKKRFACTFEGCDASFSKARKLTNHIRRHTGQRPFICDEPGCTKTYTNSSHLARHIDIAHDGLVEKVICPYENCGQIISNVSNLKRHCVAKHSLSHCLICSEGFPSKDLLKKHLLLHSNSELFKCHACSQLFKTQNLLNRHKRCHKEYVCHCNLRFVQRSQFWTHRKICIAPSQPLQCAHCDKIFWYKTNLKIHIQTIHNERTEILHECPYENCERMYRYKKNLRSHIRARHAENECNNERLPCTYEDCCATFKNKRNLTNHIQNIHVNPKPKVVKRNTRKDQGVKKNPVKAFASKLSGIPLTPLGHKNILEGRKIMETFNENIENVISVNSASDSVSEANNDSSMGIVQTTNTNS